MKYYYGTVEFGEFVIAQDSYPMAVIHSIEHTKEFLNPQEAFDFYMQSGCDSYVGEVATNEDDKRYELVFKELPF